MHRQQMERFGMAALILLTSAVLIRTAWVCDDSFISFRVVDNFIHGHGLVWNVGERVQAFTNPLWVLVMSLCDLMTGEVYYTSLILSIVLSVITLWILSFRIADNWVMAVTGLLALLLSKAFTDYSTSGLENPLTHLLLTVFCFVYFAREHTARTLLHLTFIAALCMTNRLDTILLLAPAIVYAAWGLPWRSVLKSLVVGALPIIIWEVFAVVYFGFPFPNTYYAKLHAGTTAVGMLEQGLLYVVDSLSRDPLTLLSIATVLLSVFVSKVRAHIPLAIGVVLYVLYVVRIGGDFMSGRFFAAPLLVSVVLLIRWPLAEKSWELALPVVFIAILGLTTVTPTLVSAETYGTDPKTQINAQGVADERAFYYQGTGLLHASRDKIMPDHQWAAEGRSLRNSGVKETENGAIGFLGYFAGPGVHIVDLHALSEPLLARLPYRASDRWRPGHLVRSIPGGYLRSIRTGKNMVLDSVIADYYESLRCVISGDIWSMQRFREIVRLNFGADSHLLAYASEPRPILKYYDEFNWPRPAGAYWSSPIHAILTEQGLQIVWDSTVHPPALEVSVDHNDAYRLSFLNNGHTVGKQDILPQLTKAGGLRVDTLQIAPEIREAGFDRLIMLPDSGDGLYSVGHVRMLEAE